MRHFQYEGVPSVINKTFSAFLAWQTKNFQSLESFVYLYFFFIRSISHFERLQKKKKDGCCQSSWELAKVLVAALLILMGSVHVTAGRAFMPGART